MKVMKLMKKIYSAQYLILIVKIKINRLKLVLTHTLLR